MRAIPQIRLPRAPRLSSIAGNGLPERMRTTAFAFLGLTAAAGLALVAIFAQLSFHVLSPAPLPGEPANGGAVAEAVPLHQVAVRASAVTQGREAPTAGGNAVDRGGATDGSRGVPDPSASPAPATHAPSEDGVAPEAANEATPQPASTSAPAPNAAPQEDPGQTSEPAPTSTPKPAPTSARPASPPAPVSPGNSRSGAAEAHASERAVEASSKSTATVETPPPATNSSSPSTEDTAPGNGNGKALGHTK